MACDPARMQYIRGWERVVERPRRGLRVGRRLAAAPVLIPIGVVHAEVPSGTRRRLRPLIVHREPNPFTLELATCARPAP